MGAKPPILEFLHIVHRTSNFGVLNIITNIFKTTQKPPILEYYILLLIFLKLCRTSDFGGFAAGADPPKSE